MRTGLVASTVTPGSTAPLVSLTVPAKPPVLSPCALAPPGIMSRHKTIPMPTLLASYNQIGFDSLHYLIAMVDDDAAPADRAKHGVAWMIGAK